MSIINQEQLKASNPFDSVWVSASAGTGKTKVLTDRVLRLLLQSAYPERILCLTFTKAAAAEMENRVNSVLKNWAICDENELIKNITELSQEEPDQETLKTARSLFSKVLETPGGMKIMTIHSFCQSLLKRFPIEADIPPHFEVIDDLNAQAMKQNILDEVLTSSDLKESLQELTYLISTNNLLELLGRILNETNHLTHLTQAYPGGIQTIIFNIKNYFNILKYHTENDIINEFFNIQEWAELKQNYLTQKDEIRHNKKDDSKAYQVFETNERLKAFQICHASEILLQIALRVVEKYHIYKQQNAVLDYSDLIDKTSDLLSRSTMTAWVLYKLDGGIDHILVDEAQDTNYPQWSIIKAIAEEFFSGEDNSDKLRTLFVVGDKKQSIFSFQGADPQAFERMHQYFEKRILDSQNNFCNIPLNFSFRSTEPVLRLVNYVLKNEQAKDGVLFDNEEAYHLANRSDDAGLVEIWPVEQTEKKDAPDPWKPPIERQENTSAMKRLVNRIALKIQSMIGKEILPSQNRFIEPGDILILLQKRSTMMAEIVRTLREYNIPVAGVDRLILSEHLAIQDLLALTEFVLQPYNDLNLANLIKSPILGLGEEDLYKICVDRAKNTIWQQLQKLYPQQAIALKQIMNIADKKPPFEFFSTVLGAYGMRKKFIARFGDEVNEALDEFLNLSLNFEKTNTPSLQKFSLWFNKQEIEIKRDLDNSGTNAVRVMTVHGSKGLQGNIVFLPDTCSSRSKAAVGGDIIWLENNLPIWIPNASLRPKKLHEYFAAKEHLNNQEKRRLLYVALTRAADRLYIAGYGKKSNNNWYDLIVNSLPAEITADKNGIIKWESQQKRTVHDKQKEDILLDGDVLPKWACTIPDKETPETMPLAPSMLGEEKSVFADSPLDKKNELALKRGTFLHKLLQYLPSVPSDQRKDLAQKLCPPEIDLPENVFKIFEHPDLKELFGPTSLAEVPVVGEINHKKISGQIDRLVVLPNEIKIIDFKTNRYVPQKVPEIYKKQLNAYRDLLKTIFPDKIVHTYILWTQTLYYEEVK